MISIRDAMTTAIALPPDRVAAAPPPHPLAALLARYAAVFEVSWGSRHELAGPKRLADERAFLPAALALQDSPPHPAPRRLALALCVLFTLALAWAWLGHVDVVAVAQGRIVVSERTKTLQPLEAAVVRAIHVRDGQRVAAGQVLVELDATAASADRTNVAEQLATAQGEAVRARLLLQALDDGRTPRTAPDAAAPTHTHTQTQALVASEWADIGARLARLDAEVAKRQAEGDTLRAALAKLQHTLPLARQREADIRGLAEQGFMAGHLGQDRQRERIELERDLATQQARIREAQAALAESRQAKAAFVAETRRSLNDRLAQATLKLVQLQGEGAKAQQRERLMQLAAPVAGTVQQLAIHTAGGVVTPAQPLLVIVPDDAPVTAEVVLDNKDVGFVHAGQAAEVKLETFTYTRYGTVPATVKSVSADAVVDDKRGAVFAITLALGQDRLDVDGKAIKLAPGMNLTAEIKTGERRVIEYLLSPLQRRAGESLKER
jgi:hemolysin D